MGEGYWDIDKRRQDLQGTVLVTRSTIYYKRRGEVDAAKNVGSYCQLDEWHQSR